MGGSDSADGSPTRNVIPLIAAAIVGAQMTIAIVTIAAKQATSVGVGRKRLFLCGLSCLTIRCAAILLMVHMEAGNQV